MDSSQLFCHEEREKTWYITITEREKAANRGANLKRKKIKKPKEEKHQVQTHWGSFLLDEGAYRDYLLGKLWITWVPGRQELAAESASAPFEATGNAA